MVAELKEAVKQAEKLSEKDQKSIAQFILDEFISKDSLQALAEKLSKKKTKDSLTMDEIVREVKIVRQKRALHASK